MATVYYADSYFTPVPETPNSGGIVIAQPFIYAMAANAVIGDTYHLCTIPGTLGIILVDWMVDVPTLDDSSGVTLQLGDSTTAAKFMAANDIGQGGGIVSAGIDGVVAVLPVAYDADGTATRRGDTDLVMRVSAAVTGTPSKGTIRGWIRYCQYGVNTGF